MYIIPKIRDLWYLSRLGLAIGPGLVSSSMQAMVDPVVSVSGEVAAGLPGLEKDLQ